MSSNPAHEERVCSNCKKTASLTCKACKDAPNATDGQLSSTWYCGPECQKAHWTDHKAQCKAAQARQALYRAATMAKKMFYAFMKITFMWNPGRIEKIVKTWLIHQKIYTGTSQIVPFPYDIVPDVHDQEALLTYQSCNAAVSNMHNVVKTLLEGLYSKMDEVSFYIKNAQHHLKQVYPGEGLLKIDGTDYAHTVIRITTKNDETYALDMAGAQYGWDGVIIPWKLYVNMRVREIREVMPFGRTKVFCKTRADSMGEQCKWIHRIKDDFAKNVDDAVTWWQRGHLPTTKLLRLPEQEFQRNRSSLLEMVDRFLELYKTIQESQGGFQVKGGFNHGVYDRKFTSAALGNIPGRGSPSPGTN